MKINNKYIAMALAGLFLTGCNEMDTEPLGSVITDEQREEVIEANPAMMEATVNAIFANLYAFEQNYDGMQDFGYASVIIARESRSEDFCTVDPGTYGWFEDPCKYLDNKSTSAYTIIPWGTFYSTIYSANQVCGAIDADTEDPQQMYYRAQGLGARAWAYEQLAQTYQFTYVGNESKPCVPIITDENIEEATENGAKRASVQDVYTQIMKDLDEAIALLEAAEEAGVSRLLKRQIDVATAYGLRARANLLMGEYAEAANDAMSSLKNADAMPSSVEEAAVPMFVDIDEINWIWGIDITAPEDVHGLYTYNGFMGSFSYGYAFAGMWQTININLFDKISDNDVRKGWWINPEDYSSIADNYSATYEGYPASIYLQYLVGAPELAVVKFAPYQNELLQSTGGGDVPLMRAEEMYLILAEGLAMSGNVAAGKAYLEDFVNKFRWLNPDEPYVCEATTPEDFQKEVWFQRKVELWGEGFSYFDNMRLNQPIDRANSNFDDEFDFVIPANSAVLLLQIPQKEIEGNPALTAADQNPVGSAE